MNVTTLRAGDAVRRRHAWDGTLSSGAPEGDVLTVVKVMPCDTFAICQLSDGSSEFDFNLHKPAAKMHSARFAC